MPIFTQGRTLSNKLYVWGRSSINFSKPKRTIPPKKFLLV